ncbi:TRAP transporter substrate-binding protein, partial [Chloroflexota bacterium]
KMVYADHQASTEAHMPVVKAWMDMITERSDGRITWEFYHAGTLVGPKQQLEEISRGTADIGQLAAHMQSSYFPINVATQKFFYGAPTTPAICRIYDQLDKEFPAFHKEWADVKTLIYRPMGNMDLQSTKAVRKLEDFKGLKVRVPGSWLKYTFTQLGASVVSMPPADLYIAMQKGIIDSDIHGLSYVLTYKTAELQPYTTILDMYDGISSHLVMNWDSFYGLPADIQKVIDDSLPQFQADFLATDDGIKAKGYDYVMSLGKEWIELPPEDLASFYEIAAEEGLLAARAIDAKGLPGTAMLERTRELIAEEAAKKK